jgi:hypothetical protein
LLVQLAQRAVSERAGLRRPARLRERAIDGKPNILDVHAARLPPGVGEPCVRPTSDGPYIHYSFEPDGTGAQVTRWLVLDITMPMVLLPLRRLIIKSFDDENLRTMAAVKSYAEAHPNGIPAAQPAD